ncbi:MAG TPA: POTRA domain-containing protein [Thermoanaerobaculia bacterium]|nr:POTRA domain-containing protein [Thermoanaerobaculia bacterium]
MGSSRGHRRPPVSSRALRLTAAAALFSLCLSGRPQPAAAQPSPNLLPWLRTQAASETPVLGTGLEVQGAPAIPPGSVIGEVRVNAKDIFDSARPGEDRKIFRLANRLHRTTRPVVIERQLLFQPGDVFSPELIAESARLLRRNDYLYDVDLKPVLRDDGKVDVEVTTRDLWTLQGGASFSRSGGENNTSFSLEDTNFLGTGKEISLSRIGTVDRTSNLVRYRDPNVLGSRVRLTASYADNSDGGRTRFELERPFYSLSSRWSAGLRSFRDERVENLYKAGKVVTNFEHRHDFVEVYGGLSPGLVNGTARRFRLGVTYSTDTFVRSSLGPLQFPFLIPKAQLPQQQLFDAPENRTLVYPWIGFESVQDRFVVERDLNRFQRAEDLNLGRQYNVLLGWSSPAFGGDGERLIVQSAFSAGWRPTARNLVLAQVGGSTRWAAGDAEDLTAGGRVRWYARDFGEHIFYASLGADLAHRLDGEDQLLLGGDSGLRGYPLRYQAGDRRVLLTLEQRFFSDREIFHLAHLGGAVFFDAGQAWFVGPLSKLDARFYQERRILKDAGLGLRLGSSRSSRGAVLHLDVAFPLDGSSSIERVQYLVSTSDTF